MNPTNQIIIHQMMPAVFLCLVREIISGGDVASWLIATPSVLLARIAFGRFRSERRPAIRMSRLPGFVAWLLCQSLRGSVDMAWRTLHLPVQPGFPQANPCPSRKLISHAFTLPTVHNDAVPACGRCGLINGIQQLDPY